MLGISHYSLMEETSNEEFLGWADYFKRQPDGWREDIRAYYIMSAMGGTKEKPEKIFPSIEQLKQAERDLTKEEEEAKAARKFQQGFKASPFAGVFARAGIK